MGLLPWVHLGLALLAVVLALALRPWRALPAAPPWPALAWWVLLPVLWSVDLLSAQPVMQPLAGTCLLLLMLGWPMAVLMLLPVAGAVMGLADASAADALQRLVWLGLVPMTLALALGAALRRWLPKHLFIYILGRGFLATALAVGAAGALSAWVQGVPPTLAVEDVVLARVLAAFGDAFITGMLVAVFVAFRPQWLATYTDRLYLPKT
ncbi:hypothetical protein [Rubrivivax rivuli]|uniref:Uncharacterized protein n=1 Tax=Rubrivivax rivuli TaxID=1862385 RepID=A0A437R987_9BURK|nr:hypothetical protein [Rubrivivax rivuli]RVU43292.1 hypothetical protein EOE66_20290 [Rubrivivax rivuli]